jgi:hypothetical protein
MRGGLLSRGTRPKQLSGCITVLIVLLPLLLTSLGLAAFQVHLHRQASALTSEQALLAALFMPPSLAPGARFRFLLLMMCHAALPSP